MTAPDLPAPPPGLTLPAAIVDEVRAAYAAPGRAYHGLAHLAELGRLYDEVARGPGWQRPREVFLTLLYHDLVYTVPSAANEDASAARAVDAIAAHLPGLGLDAAWVAALIRLTARHGSLHATDVDGDQALFLDCDMAVLAAPPAAYDVYEAGIAAEYASIPAAAYRAGRRAFLLRVLAGEHIFLSDHFRAREPAARANLRRAIARL